MFKVLSIYSSGLYIGAGIGLFLGGAILDTWNSAYPDHTLAPFGLKGWQAAFMGVGLPGILLSIITFFFIKEPVRGMSEGIATETSKEPFKDTFKEFIENCVGHSSARLSPFDLRLCIHLDTTIIKILASPGSHRA